MPFYIKIEAFKELENYETATIFEPFWWNQWQLRNQYEFVPVTAESMYLDYYLDLTKELFDKIRLEQTEGPEIIIYKHEVWMKKRIEVKAKLESLSNNFDSYKLVRICIAEYDSMDD